MSTTADLSEVMIEDAGAIHPPTTPARQRTGSSAKPAGEKRTGAFLRFAPDDKQQAQYWAARHGMSLNEYVAEALQEKIRRENQDYDLPTLEIARLNQLIDEMRANSINLGNLERVVTSGFESIIGLARGDSNLLDDEDGEL